MTHQLKILSLFFFGCSAVSIAQIKEERLILDRKREPELRKIEKKLSSVKIEKNYPPKEKRIQDSLNLKYEITDVPMASDFKTSKIQGQDIAPDFSNSYQNNYVRFGMGNYGKILADATVSQILENKMEVGGDVHFLSTSGLKKDYLWKSNSTGIDAGVFLNHYGDKGKANVEARFGLDDYNYYGIYAFQPSSDVDLKQRVNRVNINGFYDNFSNKILDDIRVKTTFLSDHFNSKESAVSADVNLTQDKLYIFSDIDLNAAMGIGLSALSTKFAMLDQNQSSFFLVDAKPNIEFKKGDSYIKLGVVFNYLNGNNNSIASTGLQTNVARFYPFADLQFAATEQFKVYAGVDGGYRLNSYSDLLIENPYLSPDVYIKPTETKFHIFAGIRGDLREDLKYDFSGAFSKVSDAYFFEDNALFDVDNTMKRAAYDFANSFKTIYDSGKLTEIKASLQYFPIQNLLINGNLGYYQYNLDNLGDVYNDNGFTGRIGAKYSMFNQKLLLGANVFLSPSNNVTVYDVNPATYNVNQLNTVPRQIKVPGYADLNLSAEYKFHRNFSIFALGNNLLGTKYQRYYGYKVLGAQVLGGLKFTF